MREQANSLKLNGFTEMVLLISLPVSIWGRKSAQR